jgi:histone deacetylase complex regulatory component SIN3
MCVFLKLFVHELFYKLIDSIDLKWCIGHTPEHANARQSTPVHASARQSTPEHARARQSTPVQARARQSTQVHASARQSTLENSSVLEVAIIFISLVKTIF